MTFCTTSFSGAGSRVLFREKKLTIITFIPPSFSRVQVFTPTEPYIRFGIKILKNENCQHPKLVVGFELEHTCFQSKL